MLEKGNEKKVEMSWDWVGKWNRNIGELRVHDCKAKKKKMPLSERFGSLADCLGLALKLSIAVNSIK